ncbi:P-loop containing nucleoside triphosphate hydrolase protein [Artomyces pyxidatus]|uniref:P-loop containing nucleoside triphosphate hydrolase protein n=1 Tax=Artomyces pyxidatus TaxID=48021 RepID=A0ACB8SYW2_9AGAM|nr:P-loop containing nucleoside triphosphate hydrolase protein [Artomyces pyxidatus]
MSTVDEHEKNRDSLVPVLEKEVPSDSPPAEKATVEAKAEEKLDPVAFTELFRFSTRGELIFNGLGIFAAIVGGAAQPLMTLLFGNLVEDFVSFSSAVGSYDPNDPASVASLDASAAHFRHTSSRDASYLTYIGIGLVAATWIYMNIWVYTSEVAARRVREAYLKSVLRQNIAFFDQVGAGEVATRIQTDTHLVHQSISEKVALVCVYTSSFFTGFILAYIRNWRLALAMSSIVPCIALAGVVMNKFVSKYTQLSLGHVAKGGTIAEEVISTIRTAQAFGTQKVLSDMYDNIVGQATVMDAKAALWHGIGLGTMFFVFYSSYGLAFSFGTTLINEGHATAGEVVNVFMAILIGAFSLALMPPEMQAITQGRAAAAKLFQTIDSVPEIDSSSTAGLKPETVTGEITLENVGFNYPARPEVRILKDLSIRFPAGKTAALVGASGSGKSTIIALVERFYDPLSGVVRMDGVDVKDLNVKWLRSQIGLVSQEPTLFATTIRGNVEHGLINTPHQHASAEEKLRLVKDACIKANADGFISNLPLGYDTLVGERGFLLSGGQKQRIAIARAIVSDPKILLLDEATSALDTQSEGVVQNALDKAAAGRTTITIAHRLSTIKDADCIYVMGEGVVIEHGKHAELLRDESGAYSRLVAAQKLREQKEEEDSVDDTSEKLGNPVDIEKEAADEIPLGRRDTRRSLASEIVEQRKREQTEQKTEYSLLYLFKRMGAINKSEWKRYTLGIIASILSGAVYPVFGIVWGHALTGFGLPTAHERRHSGDRYALWMFVIAIISTICIALQNFFFASSAASLTGKLRSRGFKAIMRQDIEYFDRDDHSTGSIVANLSDAPQKINGLAGITLGAIVQSLSTLVIGTIFGLAFIWKVGLIGFACIPVLLSNGYLRLTVIVQKDKKNKKAHEESAQLACEAAGAIRTVASLTREDDCLDLYSASLEGPQKESARTALFTNLLFALAQGMGYFVIALVFWYGARLVSRQEFTTTDFFIGLMSTVFSALQAGNVFSFAPDMSSAKGAASDIITLLDSRPEIDSEATDGKTPQNVRGHVRLENVHFRYPTRPGVRVLRDMNLDVKPGTYVALVGASGCGKSTVIQLIERFYDPLAGTVYIDGQAISELNVQEYRKHIALVSQEPTLYAGTIRFNILLGAAKPVADVTQDELETACRNANILEFIQSLPDGFDTEVGGKGSQLSGGQKQRIAIARALLRDPKVLLLDEATSALDSTSEKVVQAALDSAARGRTTIAIAHRLSTIQNADCIYFIKDGCVSESGTHDSLLAQRGGYFEYVQLQALNNQ